jgi:hypothetical protein
MPDDHKIRSNVRKGDHCQDFVVAQWTTTGGQHAIGALLANGRRSRPHPIGVGKALPTMNHRVRSSCFANNTCLLNLEIALPDFFTLLHILRRLI